MTDRLDFSRCRAALAAIAAAAAIAGSASPAAAVPITIHNVDSLTEGFNDDTPATPVGRNPGTTLGAQRLYVFRYAAEKWGLRLKGNVPIIVSASFSDLGGDQLSAILGFARSTTVHRDFPGVPVASTWYVASLANQFRGSDLNDLAPADCSTALVDGACPEIESQFNASVDDPAVLGDLKWYYGVDGNAGDDIDFLSVVLHEIAHGLGVLDLVEPFSGQKYFGYDDAYINNLEDKNINPKQMSRMSDLQRQVAVLDDSSLVWMGPNMLAAALPRLSSGIGKDGGVQVYAPPSFESGSSIAHLDTTVSPNELMEPFITTPAPHDLSLTVAMLADIGWATKASPACGDPNDDGHITATDAAQVLRGAVGSATCPSVICDVALPGGVTASDALSLLKLSVGQHIIVNCPAG